MFCFSEMCRICLRSLDKRFSNLNSIDTDTTKLIDMLLYCIPEIYSPHHLPEQICKKCHKFLRRMHSFKQMGLRNTAKLNKYASKLSSGSSSSVNSKAYINLDLDYINKHKLFTMAKPPTAISTPKSNFNKSLQHMKTETLSPIVTNTEGTSVYSISLNQWDLFETKFSCRCIKNFNSFTEKTEHLCKNCEGDLLGFRLSKLKVNVLENRFNNSRRIKQENEDSRSSLIEENDFDYSINDAQDYERGFDYSDISLSKVHMNGLKKQIENLEKNPSESNNYTLNTSLEAPAYCTISYEQNNTFIRESENLESKRYYCDFCDKSYAKRYRLKLHLVQNHPEFKIPSCVYCPKEFLYKSDKDKHMLRHLNDPKLKNKPEEFLFSKQIKPENISPKRKHHEVKDNSELNISKKLNSSDENLNCATCNKSFTHKSNFAIHLLTHVGKKEYKCKVCNKEFFRKENFDEHILTHSIRISTEPKHKCSLCPKMYNHPSNLQRHIKHNHENLNFHCSMCPKKFSRERDLQTHILDKHAQPRKQPIIDIRNEDEQYPCPVCKKVFLHVNNLKMHALSHVEKEKFSCSLCNKEFSWKNNLKRHEASHLAIRIKKCTMCFKTFNNREFLEAHMLEEHLNVWKHRCPICSKLYQSSTGVKRHRLSAHPNINHNNDEDHSDDAKESHGTNDIEKIEEFSDVEIIDDE